MSGKNNVNPDHYKTAGRDKPDDNAAARQTVAGAGRKSRAKKGVARPNFIPGAPPVGGSRAEDEKDRG